METGFTEPFIAAVDILGVVTEAYYPDMDWGAYVLECIQTEDVERLEEVVGVVTKVCNVLSESLPHQAPQPDPSGIEGVRTLQTTFSAPGMPEIGTAAWREMAGQGLAR